MNYYNEYTIDNELSHHGVKGQKWGVRHGPPYPLNRGRRTPKESKTHTGRTVASSTIGSNPAKSEEIDKYRSKMINRYTKSNPSKAKQYENISNEELAIEYQRRKKMQKALLATAAIVGISAACYFILREDSVDKLRKTIRVDQTPKKELEVAKKAINQSLEDLDYVISEGSTMHRMVAFENFNLEKTKGKATYVTVKDRDRLAYMAFLRDFSGTGKRYDVSLKATKDIIAPSDEKAKQIFDELWKSDPSYKDALIDTLVDWRVNNIYAGTKNEEVIQLIKEEITNDIEKDAFNEGIKTIALQRGDAKKLIDAYKSHGYNALVDYHDKGIVSELPLILFDALTDTIKTGEEFVTQDMKIAAVKELAEIQGHPLQMTAAEWVASLPRSKMLENL